MQSIVGARLRRVRLQGNLSIRQVAEAANLSKTTVVHVESGRTSRRSSYLKVARFLGLHLEHLLAPEGGSELPYAAHFQANDKWFDLASFDEGPLPESAQFNPEERARLSQANGLSPLNILASRLENGRIKPTVLEVFGPTPPRSHQGEELVYVLEGQAIITVSGKSIALNEGESITFWSAEQHSYAPRPGSKLPVRLLSARVDT
jgi:transcriptional regulator with XRE-family HTH domain